MLAHDFVLEWPQSGECIHGPERFAQMNAEYRAHGSWSFIVNRIVSDQSQVVSAATVTDGVQTVRAISFFEVSGGTIARIVEF